MNTQARPPGIRIACGLALLAVCGTAAAQEQGSAVQRSVELALSNHAAQVRYRAPTDIGGLPESEVDYGAFLSEDRDFVASAGLLFGSRFNFGALHAQLGPKAYAALLNEENNDVFAISIGTQIRYDLVPSGSLAVVGTAYWSPDVLTFGSANNISDLSVRAETQLGDRLRGFVGYRWFRLDLTTLDNRNLENELYAGINWRLP